MPDRPAPAFRPLPFLGNPHVQTVVANLWGWTRDRLPSTQHLVRLDDGDALAMQETTPVGWEAGGACAVLVHGLGGCHRSAYLRRMANDLGLRGTRVYRLDLRGAGAGAGHARRLYHAGCSADVRAALAWVGERNPG